LCSLLVLVPCEAAAQGTGIVVGVVSDSTRQPLRDVLVFVDDGQASARTDSLGMFRLEGVTRVTHRLHYRASGYGPRSYGLEFPSDLDIVDVGRVVLRPGAEPTAILTGRVTEGVGGTGLAGATVELNGRVVAVTDSTGAFDAQGAVVAWGANDIVVRHRAFSDRSVTDSIFVADARQTFDLDVALEVVPVMLAEIPVPIQSARLAAEGFYERREEAGAAGIFWTRDDIAARNPRRIDDMFRGVNIVARAIRQQQPVDGGPAQNFSRADDGRPCIPVYFLDGVRMGELFQDRGVSSGLEQLVTVDEVEGIEIYETVARLPAKFSPIGAMCGVIVIWTR